MDNKFDAFNERLDTDPRPDEQLRTPKEMDSTPPETQVRDVTVIGENNDRLKVSAETAEGTIEEELCITEVEQAMRYLAITDARDLEGQPVFARKDKEGGSYLEFEPALE